MKWIIWVGMTALLGANVAGADLKSELQKGLFEEEGNRNVVAAIQSYEKIMREHEQDRDIAATALFRLAECYRKTGRTNEAVAALGQLTTRFLEQTQLVALARQNLAGLGISPAQVRETQGDGSSLEAAELARIQALAEGSPDLIKGKKGGDRLSQAVSKGFLRVADFLIKNGADPNASSQPPIALPLHEAAMQGNTAATELLLRARADINAKDGSRRETPLHIAASRGSKSLTELLLKNGADPNLSDTSGKAPLHSAANAGMLEIMRLLIANKADVNLRAVPANAPNHPEIDPAMMKRYGLPGQSSNSSSPLEEAISGGRVDAMKLLLQSGASAKGSLLRAVQTGNREIVQIILEAGEKPGTEKDESKQVLAMALGAPPEILEMLLRAGGNANQTVLQQVSYPTGNISQEKTLLLRAIENSSLAACRILLEHGANPDAGAKNYAPLRAAVDRASFSKTKLLLDFKANINPLTQEGYTPFYFVLKYADLSRVPEKFRDAARLEPNLPKAPPQGELNEAEKTRAAIADLLLEAGANPVLHRMSQLGVMRSSTGYIYPVFFKTLNATNRFTLLELVAQTLPNSKVDFPNFSRAIIHRFKSNAVEDISVDLNAIWDSGDCKKDIVLHWGDFLDVPEMEHALSDTWKGLSELQATNFARCLSRTIQIKRGENLKTVEVTGAPTTRLGRPGQLPRWVSWTPRWAPQIIKTKGDLTTTDDLKHVQIHRRDPLSGEMITIETNLELDNPPSGSDTWLRDGDVVEIRPRQVASGALASP